MANAISRETIEYVGILAKLELSPEEKGLKVVSDEGALRQVIQEILDKNPQSVADYKAGKQKAMGFVVGQTMRAMKGKADPAVVNQLVKGILEAEI